MTLTDTAYLEIDDGNGTTATFELSTGFEEDLEGSKTFIMADRGQYIQEIADQLVSELGVDDINERRRGFTIDGGAGTVQRQVSFETGMEDVRWGDGSGGTGPSNVTTTDASGAEVEPVDRRDVLAYWCQRTRTDSLGPQARLHWGQWTDGNVSGVSGVSAAAHNQPLPVSILEWSLPTPNVDDSVSSFEGSLTLKEVAIFPSEAIPAWVQDAAATVNEQIAGVNER